MHFNAEHVAQHLLLYGGQFTQESWLMFAAAFSAMLAGTYVGDRVHMKHSEGTFRRLVCATLFFCGITLLLE